MYFYVPWLVGTAVLLLFISILPSSYENDLRDALDSGVEIIVRCINVDRVYVWKNL
jgi:hypothetical protein